MLARLAFSLWSILWLTCLPAAAQDAPAPAATTPEPAPPASTSTSEAKLPAPAKIDVQPQAHDDDISGRLERILDATGWFQDPQLRVQEGVVFLSGTAQDQPSKEWASELARRTEDVVAVVNQMEVVKSSVWDFGPAIAGTRDIWRQTVGFLPFAAFGALIMTITWLAARLASRSTRAVLRARMSAALLADVIARAAAVIIILLGLYTVLRVSGLTRLALTVLGGTGLLGLALGIAFRDITENFLASIFLSLQHPFRVGDLVEINGVQGYVRQLNIRTTVLMTLTGNHVQIPNSVVYKSMLFNFTSNPNRREDFSITLGMGDSVSDAQQALVKLLHDHPAVLKDPEPWVLVDTFAAGTLNLRVYYWIDGTAHSWLKVRSSVMRLAKQSLQERGMLKTNDMRESFFPKGIEVQLIERTTPDNRPRDRDGQSDKSPKKNENKRVYTTAEGVLTSDAAQLEEQARQSRAPEEGENLLKPADPEPAPASPR